ncbi:MAG: hypothetical protein ACRECN_07295, partial [Methylocella sp.]
KLRDQSTRLGELRLSPKMLWTTTVSNGNDHGLTGLQPGKPGLYFCFRWSERIFQPVKKCAGFSRRNKWG